MSTRIPTDELELTIIRGLTHEYHVSRDGRLYASDSGYCQRQTALSALRNEDVKQEPQTTAYFDLGKAVESLIVNSLYTQKTVMFTQYILPDVGMNLGGKIDAIIRLDGHPVTAIEIKSCGSIPKEPYPEHLAQAYMYSGVTGLPTKLVYFGRNVINFSGKLQLKTFDLGYDISAISKTINRAALGYYSSLEGVLPNIPSHITSEKDCGFCPFKNVCWHGEKSILASATKGQANAIIKQANDKTKEITDKDNTESRRNGIFRFLKTHGTQYAKDLLTSTKWDDLVLF